MKPSHPFRSTTHEERFYHLKGENDYWRVKRNVTLFARKENGMWHGCIAICHTNDAFCRRRGRTVARRKYFAEPKKTAIIGQKLTFALVLEFSSGMLARQLPEAAYKAA